jgi:hypothetical protein
MDADESSPRHRRAVALVAAVVAGLVAIAGVLLVTGGGASRHAGAKGAGGYTSVGATGPESTSATGTAPPTASVIGPAAVGPRAQPPPSGAEQFGASVNRLFNDGTYTPAQIDLQLRQLQQTGVTVARSDALWEATEPKAPADGLHHYDWSFDDAIAGSLAAHGLRWLPIIDYSAAWAQSVAGQDHSAPLMAADYAAYAGALAARYGQGGSFWRAHPNLTAEPVDTYEIWNEPDNATFWAPAPDASVYDDLYLRARDAIAVPQPGARVIVGGLTKPAAFLPAMLAGRPDMLGHIDGVAIHPYGRNPEAVLANVRTARRMLASVGLGAVPLYVTEFGWTTHPVGALDFAPQHLRPGYISRTLIALGHVDCGVALAILYTWVTPERDPVNAQDWFGINPPAGGPSADTTAFAEGRRDGAAAGPAISLCP